ncbi:Tyrosinase [Macleaya cordata]|uniref:Tyrosinase n=1 Tax=Macleaya cordata TaxID=56857 RepID=A0A200PQQ4_MACCD|nr:Tyrosinase [Macleaya cordata]
MSLSLLATTTIPSASYSGNNPLWRTNKSLQPPVHVGKRVAYTLCENKQTKDGSVESHVIDRRNVLLGLGGITTATIGTQGMSAVGAPLAPPDLSKCHLATDDESKKKVNCCPPYSSANIVDFKPPSCDEALRVRKPAHKLTKFEVERFEAAIAAMKNLKPDDPWHYSQQATIHCTYCNGAYDQVGTNTLLQVHGSWFFLPWHRYYLYFWERILGKLIKDDTFAIPYWNWDTPKGMYMPKMYLNSKSPLYDDTRDKNHYESVLDYKYAYNDPNPVGPQIDEVITTNLCHIDRMYKESKRHPALFMGKPLRAGQPVPTNASGSCENLHNTMHQWVGPPTSPYYNMGNFYTAAHDTMFFGHHGNVDRMWDLYSKFRGEKPEFKDPDWLESAFVFYDENRQVVKVKVKDCLTPEQLRYAYQPEKLPWADVGRKCKKLKKTAKKRSSGDSMKLTPAADFGSEPRILTETVQAIVKRPKISRSKSEKEDASEVLFIKGVDVKSGSAARFDVYVGKPIEGLAGPDYGEYAGSFVKIPHGHHGSAHAEHKASLELGITTLLEDIEAEGSDTLIVTLVPRNGEVTIEGIEIELFTHEDDD